MDHIDVLRLDTGTRRDLWERTVQIVESYLEGVDQARVSPELNPGEIRAYLSQVDFNHPLTPQQAVDFVARGLWEHQVHTAHPRYFGLFNPTPSSMGVAADALAAAFNPQLAAWSHNPFAVELENHLIQALAERFGYNREVADGTFATGGAEANHTAVLTALEEAFPAYGRSGVRALDGEPALYVSSESHHSFIKAARACGLGSDAVRQIPVTASLQMDLPVLAERIRMDRKEGRIPFLVVGTAGTTNAGVIDPLESLAELTAEAGLWFHVDAAWGGAAVLVPELRRALRGIEGADSITFDAHKWLSVPMAAGIFLTRHREILNRTFRITADYMPTEGAGLEVVEPYTHSIQWSRRFIGLKVFLSLAVAGWGGYASAIRHQTAMADRLRDELRTAGWSVVNRTVLPVVCFVGDEAGLGRSADFIDAVGRAVVASGEAWISTVRLGTGVVALRACVTSFRTQPEDIHALVETLNRARAEVSGGV